MYALTNFVLKFDIPTLLIISLVWMMVGLVHFFAREIGWSAQRQFGNLSEFIQGDSNASCNHSFES